MKSPICAVIRVLAVVAVLCVQSTASRVVAESTSATADPSLMNAGSDEILAQRFVPSPEQKVGEVRLIRRGDAIVVQTLLYTKILKRVVGEIRKKELGNWQAGEPGHADSLQYLAALDEVQQQIWDDFPKNERQSDRRQMMFIEFAASPNATIVAIGSFELESKTGDVVVTARKPRKLLDVSRAYIRRNMQLIADDSLKMPAAEFEAILVKRGVGP